MAVSRNNVIVKNFHGRIGNIVLRVFGNKMVMSALPSTRNRKWSEAQLACQDQFRKATKFGHKVLDNVELDMFYKKHAKENQSSWNASISDYLLKPEIETIDTSKYNGQEGDIIKVEAYDKYKVASVIVMIINALGLQIESGIAFAMPTGKWVYKVTAENPDWKGSRVVVRVSDLPGNVVEGNAVLDGT
jgi:formylmethanofuran dehydrogenase subunit D